jgi:hypothetical protein
MHLLMLGRISGHEISQLFCNSDEPQSSNLKEMVVWGKSHVETLQPRLATLRTEHHHSCSNRHIFLNIVRQGAAVAGYTGLELCSTCSWPSISKRMTLNSSTTGNIISVHKAAWLLFLDAVEQEPAYDCGATTGASWRELGIGIFPTDLAS